MFKEISCSELTFKFFLFFILIPGNLCHNHISQLKCFQFEPNYLIKKLIKFENDLFKNKYACIQ